MQPTSAGILRRWTQDCSARTVIKNSTMTPLHGLGKVVVNSGDSHVASEYPRVTLVISVATQTNYEGVGNQAY
jgi:hypothetical protein